MMSRQPAIRQGAKTFDESQMMRRDNRFITFLLDECRKEVFLLGNLSNEKVAGVYTIWEARKLVEELGIEGAAGRIRLVVMGTFEPLEAVGLSFQVKKVFPKIKFEKLHLNGVEAYPFGKDGSGVLSASMEGVVGDKIQSGAHIIEELVNGKKVRIKAQGRISDCFSRKDLDDLVDLKTLESAKLQVTISRELKGFGIINSSEKSIISDLGALLPDNGNINYSGCGEISPFSYRSLLNHIKVGTPIFVGGAIGSVTEIGEELVLRANLREMNCKFLRAGSFGKSGSALYLGIGIPFGINTKEDLQHLMDGNEKLMIDIFDLGNPENNEVACGQFSVNQLSQGNVIYRGKETRTASTASVLKAKEVILELKEKIERGEFPICQKHE